MTLRLFNTLTRRTEPFTPLAGNEVRMYSCGPTVYNFVHIGNLRAYIFVDQLRRYLKYKGYSLRHVMNITDVDDKTIRDSRAEGRSLEEFTGYYTDAFLEDLETLNIERPELLPRATGAIPEMVELVSKLRDTGHAYEKNGTWYFKISSFREYGRLARLKLRDLLHNADGRLTDSDEYEKEDARDFALWKATTEEDGEVFWDTPLGRGRPGWHIECSAMSTAHLGQPFDIHTGGVDLIFPHHTNEIAQSEAAHGTEFVKVWLHNEHLLVNGQKMSKSLGNFFTLRDLMDKGYDPKAIRYQLLSVHYRQQLNFTEEALRQIPSTLERFHDLNDRLEDLAAKQAGGEPGREMTDAIHDAEEAFRQAMDDDLNISAGLAAVFTFMHAAHRFMDTGRAGPADARIAREAMRRFDSVLGIGDRAQEALPGEVIDLVEQRREARTRKDFAASDRIRDRLRQMGYAVDDTPEGPKVKKL